MGFIVASLIALLKKLPSVIIYFIEIMACVLLITEVFGKRYMLLKNEEVSPQDFSQSLKNFQKKLQ